MELLDPAFREIVSPFIRISRSLVEVASFAEEYYQGLGNNAVGDKKGKEAGKPSALGAWSAIQLVETREDTETEVQQQAIITVIQQP